MNSLWSDAEAAEFSDDPIALRVYTSRLLGREPALVLHGGGNTSVKASITNLFGDTDQVLFIKGSGGDLATITEKGFAPVRMDTLLKMATLEHLSDTEMVRLQRAAMTDPYAPNPSVEAILHALIPYRYVDHTHADAVVAITNTPGGEERIRAAYGDKVLIIPYVMPGFVLARAVYEATRGADWSQYQGMILLNHGIFTFGDDARTSYDRMISLVDQAQSYLQSNDADWSEIGVSDPTDFAGLATLRKAVSEARRAPMLARLDDGPAAVGYSNLPNVRALAGQGPLTPDHIIRTKRVPMIVDDDARDSVKAYAGDYQRYFEAWSKDGQQMLDPAPRWAVLPGQGTVAFGATIRDMQIVSDIVEHTREVQQWSENLAGWKALSEGDLFEMEYWELEQAKLKSLGSALPLQGRIALVTGAASGIGKAAVEALLAQGACVGAIDIDPKLPELFPANSVLPINCDVTGADRVRSAVEQVVASFGGIDIVVSNAGIFPPSETIGDMNASVWQKSLDINLTSHQIVLQAALPYLELAWQPSVVIVGSKNVPAPGPGVSAYSVAKAGLNQLARVAALEWAPKGIRVNTVHPNAVFDTGIWTPEVLEKRAKHYGLTVEEYKTNNLLKVEVTSHDVAAVICALAGSQFSRTTGAQIPIDGGNDRVI